jgi:hypothetical protein
MFSTSIFRTHGLAVQPVQLADKREELAAKGRKIVAQLRQEKLGPQPADGRTFNQFSGWIG